MNVAVAFFTQHGDPGSKCELDAAGRSKREATDRALLDATADWRASGPQKAEPTSAWRDANVAIPAFSVKDLAGRTWTARDLRGKVVFGAVWATWCAPCKAELGFVRKLRERYAGRKDVVVLTVNSDANPALVKPFVERERFDGTVLLARELAEKMGMGSILPASFVADAGGVVRFTTQGVGVEGEELWLKQAGEVIDRVLSP